MNTESKQIWIGRPHLVLGKDVARAVADVGLNGHKELWFEVPADRKDDLVTERADAFVLMLLRQALLTGANIFSEAPVSRELLDSLNDGLLPRLSQSVERFQGVKVHALPCQPSSGGEEVATGYSGGVDSLYTVSTYLDDRNGLRLDSLACFDAGVYEEIGDRRTRLYNEALNQTKDIAERFGLGCVGVRSNIQDIVDELYLAVDTYRLIACAMAVNNRIGTYLHSGAYELESLSIDPDNVAYYDSLLADAFSTKTLHVMVSGSDKKRIEKISFLAQQDEKTRSLVHVCVHNPLPLAGNCGVCPKCIRTELAMEGLGVLDRFDKAFPLETIRKNHDELEAKARLGSRNQHYMEAVKAMDEKGIHASESVRRKMRGGAAAEAVIKANREKLLEKAKETGLL